MSRRLSPLREWQLDMRRAGLSMRTYAVAWAVANYMNGDGENAWPAIETLAADINVTRATVDRGLRELRDEGWLRVVNQGGGRQKTTTYAIAYPNHMNRVSTDAVSDKPRQESQETASEQPVNRVSGDAGTSHTYPTNWGANAPIKRTTPTTGYCDTCDKRMNGHCSRGHCPNEIRTRRKERQR